MEEDSEINLKRFIPHKASGWYLIKVSIYVVVLSGLIYVILNKLSEVKKSRKVPAKEIYGIEVDTKEN